MKLKSAKQEPILKQFYLYFLVASVIPFFILLYLISQFIFTGKIDASSIHFRLLFIFAGMFSVLGFLGTRGFLSKISALSKNLEKRALGKIDKDTILELAKGDEEVAQLAKVFSEIVTDLEENVRELKETKKTLYQVLSKIGNSVSSIENFDALIKFILEAIVEALGAHRGVIFLLEEENKILKPKAIVGIDEKLVQSKAGLGEEAAIWVVKERKPLIVPLTEKEAGDSSFRTPLIVAPLVAHDRVWGAICVSGKKQNENFSEEELSVLLNLAYQIAVFFENTSLNAEVEKIYFETISALALAVEAKSPYSRGHSERVAKYAMKIAEYLGLPQEDLSTLRDAAQLHDIGKIGIADEILDKPGELTTEEWMLMKRHPQIGERIVGPLRSFRRVVNPIKHHHEFLDGSGYPDGLKSAEIPLVTRILTVADIFDALTTDRPYRKAFSTKAAKDELEAMVQLGKIDGNAVNSLFDLVENKKI